MSETADSVREKIRAYIVREYFSGNAPDLVDETRLITDGHIDSVAVMVLVDFLEKSFGVEFEPYEVDADNLDTIELMTSFVVDKMSRESR